MVSHARNRVYGTADGVIARAGRASEDPHAMTDDARWGKIAKHVAIVLKENPNLTAEQAAKAGRLRLRAEMTKLSRSRASVKAAERRRLGMDASGLLDCGSDGVDAD